MALTNNLEEFNLKWATSFLLESQNLAPIFGVDLVAIHHVGSTSIPGMIAKPEIDILVVLAPGSNFPNYIKLVETAGYRFRHDVDFGFGHWYFSKDLNGQRTHKLHLCSTQHPNVQEQLGFRDYLIRHPEKADSYRQLKMHLESSNLGGMREYLDGKAPFIQEILKLAKL